MGDADRRMTLIKGKQSEEERMSASTNDALAQIKVAYDALQKAELEQRKVNGSATESVNAAEAAFAACVEEPTSIGAPQDQRSEKLLRVEQSWQSLQEVLAKAKSDRHLARTAVEAASKKLGDVIVASHQTSLEFGDGEAYEMTGEDA